jgi:hypothetical protein
MLQLQIAHLALNSNQLPTFSIKLLSKFWQLNSSLMALPLPDVGVVIMIMMLHTVSLSNIDIYLYLFKKKIVIVNFNVLWSPSLLC